MSKTYEEHLECQQSSYVCHAKSVSDIGYELMDFVREGKHPATLIQNILYTGLLTTNEDLKKKIIEDTFKSLKDEGIVHESVETLESFLRPYELVIEIADKRTQSDAKIVSIINPTKKVKLKGVRIDITLRKEIKTD